MGRVAAGQIFQTAVAGLALIGASACNEMNRSVNASNATAGANESAPAGKHAPNPSRQYPPSSAFAQFERIDAGRFHSTEQFTVFNPATAGGAVDSIQYQYVYSDDRFAGARSYNFDVTLRITKFPSAEMARARLESYLARAIPIARADSVRLPPCRGQKSASDDFVGPDKIVRTLPNPRGGEITILHTGDFNMYDCTRGSNQTELAVWTEGEFSFTAEASPMASRPGDGGYGRAEELAVDYTNALGPRR